MHICNSERMRGNNLIYTDISLGTIVRIKKMQSSIYNYIQTFFSSWFRCVSATRKSLLIFRIYVLFFFRFVFASIYFCMGFVKPSCVSILFYILFNWNFSINLGYKIFLMNNSYSKQSK